MDEAEKMYQRALQGQEKAWGPEHTSTLNTVNNLGNLYAKQGKLAEGERCLAARKYALPEGWEARQTTDGRVYFVHHGTKSTTWVNPSLLEPHSVLPEGWEARQTEGGRVYFVNHISKSTSWVNPNLLEHHLVLPEGG